MPQFASLIADLRRGHAARREYETAIEMASALEALDGENKRLREQHAALEAAHNALQAAHDKKMAALEHDYAQLSQARMAQAATLHAELEAATLVRQERAERAREHVIATEAHLAGTRVQHEQAMRILRNELVATQTELEALRQRLADEKAEAQKQFRHLRALVDREIT